MYKNEDLDLFDAAERVNGWVEEALKENRKITISFKNAEASHGVMGKSSEISMTDIPTIS
jgi:hypothetical protein